MIHLNSQRPPPPTLLNECKRLSQSIVSNNLNDCHRLTADDRRPTSLAFVPSSMCSSPSVSRVLWPLFGISDGAPSNLERLYTRLHDTATTYNLKPSLAFPWSINLSQSINRYYIVYKTQRKSYWADLLLCWPGHTGPFVWQCSIHLLLIQ